MNSYLNIGSKPFVPSRKLFTTKKEELLIVFNTPRELETERKRRKEELTLKQKINEFCLDELENGIDEDQYNTFVE